MTNRALLQSLLLHILLILVLSLGVEFEPQSLVRPSAPKALVEARIIDPAAVEREAKRLKAQEDAARQAREREAEQAAAKARELAAQRRADEERVRELAAERERLKRERAQEQARLEAERKARAEQARKDKERAQEQAAREAAQAAAEKQAAAERAAEQKRLEQALQAEMAAEEAANRAAADSAEINRFLVAIQNRVRQSFTILPGHDGLSCTLRITLIPGGEVAGVEIIRSSGDATFDRQAENAVRKAAPLPVPADPRLFRQMRSIQFVFDPHN